MNFKKGEYISFTQEEYSDYSVLGFYVALKDFDLTKRISQYHKAHENEKRTNSIRDRFIGWLIKKRCVRLIKYREAHIGEYNTLALDEE